MSFRHPATLSLHRPAFVLVGLLLAAAWQAPHALAQQELRLTAEQWRQDLAFVRQKLDEVHPDAFSRMPEVEFRAAYRDLEERLSDLTDFESVFEISKLVSSLQDGHTGLGGGIEYLSGQLPVEFYRFSDALFIRAAARAQAELVGRRVVRIGDWAADQAWDRVAAIVSADNESTRLSRVPSSLRIPEVLWGLGLTSVRLPVELELESPDGTRSVVRLRPVPFDSVRDWVDLCCVDDRPLYLRRPQDRYWFERLADHASMYVQFNAVRNKDDESIADFFGRVFRLAEAERVERFILDLRFNGGGNGYFNRPIIEGLAASEWLNRPGRLFVVIGRQTFSAAQKLATALEQQTEAIFVGEPTGGSPNHFGDSESFRLPNSGLTLTVSTIHWQDAGADDRRTALTPDLVVDLSSEDYRLGRDPALEAIIAGPRGRFLRHLGPILSG